MLTFNHGDHKGITKLDVDLFLLRVNLKYYDDSTLFSYCFLLSYSNKHLAPFISKHNKNKSSLISNLYFELVISKDGEVAEVNIYSEIDIIIGIELKKELLQMPHWNPGKINGELLCMQVMIPIKCFKWEN